MNGLVLAVAEAYKPIQRSVLIRVNLVHFRSMYFNAMTELHRQDEHHAIEAKLNMLAQSKNIACVVDRRRGQAGLVRSRGSVA